MQIVHGDLLLVRNVICGEGKTSLDLAFESYGNATVKRTICLSGYWPRSGATGRVRRQRHAVGRFTDQPSSTRRGEQRGHLLQGNVEKSDTLRRRSFFRESTDP